MLRKYSLSDKFSFYISSQDQRKMKVPSEKSFVTKKLGLSGRNESYFQVLHRFVQLYMQKNSDRMCTRL